MNSKRKSALIILLLVNILAFAWHMWLHCLPPYLSYFSQLTVLGQILVIIAFILAINNYKQHRFSKLQSRLYILTFSIETVAVLGFWALRVFFTEGIIGADEKRDALIEALSFWVHGGSYLCLIYIGRGGQVQL